MDNRKVRNGFRLFEAFIKEQARASYLIFKATQKSSSNFSMSTFHATQIQLALLCAEYESLPASIER